IGEAARCSIRSARAAGVAVAIRNVDTRGPYRRQDRSIKLNQQDRLHSVNLFHVNADQTEAIVERLGPSFLRDRYNIGYWLWELEDFPDRWMPAFGFYNEIWTPTAFCQTAISRKSRIPVVRIPLAIQLDPCAPADRSTFGIPRDAVLFTAVFDL